LLLLQYAWFDVWWLNGFSDKSGVMQYEIADQRTLHYLGMNMMASFFKNTVPAETL